MPPGFQGMSGAHQSNQKLTAFPKPLTPSPVNPIPGSVHLLTRKKTLLGVPAAFPSFACVTTQYPRPGLGILTQFPFDRSGKARLATDFSYLLGSTNPRPIAVHVEPFPTSVFKVLI